MSLGPILVTGRSGQMANALLDACRVAGREAIALGRDAFDLTDRQCVLTRVSELAPTLIFNTAAYTAVDRAESEPDTAFALNRDGARHIAEAAASTGAHLVHFCTDYVFSGETGRPLVESDEPRPLSVYGRSKLEGTRAVLDTCPQAAVLRTSAVFSPYGGNFVKTMIRLAANRDEVQIVDDQVTAPTPADDLARIALRVAETEGHGLFHVSGRPELSWADFAAAIFDALARRGHRVPRLVRVSTADFGAPAPRPAYSVLADTRLDGLIGAWSIEWRPALERTLDASLDEG